MKRISKLFVIIVTVFLSIMLASEQSPKVVAANETHSISEQDNVCFNHYIVKDESLSLQSTCGSSGQLVYHCPNCEYFKITLLDCFEHRYEEYSKTMATCDRDGKIIYKCTLCNQEKSEIVKQLQHKYKTNPPHVQNGDLVQVSKCKNCNTTKKKVLERNFKEKYGYICNVISEDLGINVPVCSYMTCDYSPQYLTDKENCAAFIYMCRKEVIADHKHQGFDKIKLAKPGKTTLTFDNNTYICIDKFNGHNTGKELTDQNYKFIDMSFPGTLILYTCNDNWKNVTITLWDVVD